MAPTLSKKERSRMQIMHAAKVLFEQKGSQNVTFNEIAEEADMCRTTIFNHFPSINDLMVALMKQEVIDVLEAAKATGKSGHELILAMFTQLIDDMCNYPALTLRLMTNSILSESGHDNMEQLQQLMVENLEDDGLSDTEIQDMVIYCSGLFYGMVNHYFINDLPFDKPEMQARIVRMMYPILEGALRNQ